MRVERWAIAAVAALGLAVSPGLARQTVEPISVGRAVVAPLRTEDVADAPDGDVAITAPPAFTGAPAVAAAPAPTFGRTVQHGGTYALVVGINDYPGSRYDLAGASGDADSLDQALEGFGVPAANRVLLRDGQATAAAITASLRQLAASGDADSTLVFSFAGHARKLDRDTEELIAADEGTITDAELAAILATARAKHVWLLLDSCYSGGFTEALAPGRVLTAAASADHNAYENRDLRASYLAHYLIREGWLEGKAGPSVQEAFHYADSAIAKVFPDRRPVEIDLAGEPVVLGPGSPVTTTPRVPPAPSPQRAPTPSPSPTTTTPPSPPPTDTPTEIRDCSLVVFCKD